MHYNIFIFRNYKSFFNKYWILILKITIKFNKFIKISLLFLDYKEIPIYKYNILRNF